MRKVKIAQIGTSYYSHGSQIFDLVKTQNDIFEIVGYAFPENEREKFAHLMPIFDGYREMSVEEILKDPEIEAVLIEGEEIYLSKYAIMAADHKKHIHMEKPGGTSLSDFERLIDTVKKNGLVFHTGYMYRYNPCVEELLRRVEADELGKIVSIEAQMNTCYFDIDRQWFENFPGGNMFFLGGHLIDFILRIKGLPKNVVPFNSCTGKDGITSKDFAMAVLSYDDGSCFVKTAANEVGGRRHLVVSGSKATAIIDPIEESTNGGLYGRLTQTGKEDFVSKPFGRYDAMMESFAKMVTGELENPYSYDYELDLFRLLLECCG